MCSLKKIHDNSNECQHDIFYVNKVKPINKIHAQSCNRNAIKLKKQSTRTMSTLLWCLSLYKATLFETFFLTTINILIQCALPTFPEIQSFYLVLSRSHRRCAIIKGDLRNFTKFKEKHLCQSLLLNKVAGLRPATLLKMRSWHRCFL